MDSVCEEKKKYMEMGAGFDQNTLGTRDILEELKETEKNGEFYGLQFVFLKFPRLL